MFDYYLFFGLMGVVLLNALIAVGLFFRLRKEIRLTIKPYFLDISLKTADLVSFTKDVWQFEKRFQKISDDLNDIQRKVMLSSLRRFKDFLALHELEYMDYTNQKFHEGMNIEVITFEQNDSIKEPIIIDTVAPSISHKASLIKRAQVIVQKSS